MLPQSMDPRNLNVYLRMLADTLHNLIGCSLLEVDGLTIPLHYRVLRRFQGWRKSKHGLVKQNGFLHIGSRQHRADSFRYRCAFHYGDLTSLIVSLCADMMAQRGSQFEP